MTGGVGCRAQGCDGTKHQQYGEVLCEWFRADWLKSGAWDRFAHCVSSLFVIMWHERGSEIPVWWKYEMDPQVRNENVERRSTSRVGPSATWWPSGCGMQRTW